jgi:hypothetical protein
MISTEYVATFREIINLTLPSVPRDTGGNPANKLPSG